MSSLKLANVHNSLFNFLKQDRGSCLFFFLVGLTLRGIPELLVSWYPMGYETITYYAPAMVTFPGRSAVNVFVEFFRSGPLFYVLMWVATNLTGADVFVILKIVGPLFYGGLVVSFFLFLRYGLKFEWKLAFVASFLLTFQIATLRESWDRFRTELGLIFLFAALTTLKSNYKHKWLFVSALAILTTISREYIALVLFVTILGYTLLEKKDRMPSLFALSPAVAVFLSTIYPRWLWLVWNYVPESQYASRSYLWVVQDAFAIFVICYFALLPFAIKGWQRNTLIDSMTGWLLVGSFSVAFPWWSIPGYQRWLMLLVFPLSVAAVKGFERFQLFSKRRIPMLTAIVLAFSIVGAGYSSGAFSYVGLLPNSYVAVNLVQTSISWNQVDDVKELLKWLDLNAVANSMLLVEERFYGWTLIYLKRATSDIEVVPYGANYSPATFLESALEKNSSLVYLIWYTETTVKDFRVVYSQNTVSIFQHQPKIASF